MDFPADFLKGTQERSASGHLSCAASVGTALLDPLVVAKTQREVRSFQVRCSSLLYQWLFEMVYPGDVDA